jgi:hypothetical protein
MAQRAELQSRERVDRSRVGQRDCADVVDDRAPAHVHVQV